MAFTAIRSILSEKTARDPALRESETLRRLNEVWQRQLLPSVFPAPSRKRLFETTEIASLKRGECTLRTSDAATAAAIMTKREEILSAFRNAAPEEEIRRIAVRCHPKRHSPQT